MDTVNEIIKAGYAFHQQHGTRARCLHVNPATRDIILDDYWAYRSSDPVHIEVNGIPVHADLKCPGIAFAYSLEAE